MIQHDFCGLDFGTSNSTIGIFDGRQTRMVPLEQGKPTIRSAIFFDYDNDTCLFGQQGVDDYLSGAHGRLMMSLKSILGSSLMQEKTLIQTEWVAFTDILGCLIRHIKQKAENELQSEITRVVMGRPVRFNDRSLKRDKLAQDTLEAIARKEGFKTVLFQYEPIAAALAYEQSLTKEQLALIVDLGGGTSDFSVIRLSPAKGQNDRMKDVLANQGIHIGGTDFDKRFNLKCVMPELGLGGVMRGFSGNPVEIPNSVYYDLTTWHTLNSLYTHKTKREIQEIRNHALVKKPIERLLKVIEHQQGHRILNEVERAKCFLSDLTTVNMDLRFIEPEFKIDVTREKFEKTIRHKVEELTQTLLNTVTEAGIHNNQIDSIFFTGGSTEIPMIRDEIMKHFQTASLVKGDVFSSVGKGLIIDAQQKFLGN